jgi:hypothetical protein
MMALYRAAAGAAYFLAGWLDRFYEPMGPATFYLFTAGMTAAGGAAVFGAWRWWVHALGPAEEAMEGAA